MIIRNCLAVLCCIFFSTILPRTSVPADLTNAEEWRSSGFKIDVVAPERSKQLPELTRLAQAFIQIPHNQRSHRPLDSPTPSQADQDNTPECPAGQWYDPERRRCVVPGDGDADVEENFRNELRSECQFPCGDGWCCPNERSCGRCSNLHGNQKIACYNKIECWQRQNTSQGDESEFFRTLRGLVGAIEKSSEQARRELNNLCLDPSSMSLIRSAAENGYVEAQVTLGRAYHLGKGLPIDYGMARYWYENAAARDSAAAECNLGFLYHGGKGAPQDRSTALYWFQRAARHGDADAQRMLTTEYGDP